MARIYDISRALHTGMGVWPGDQPFRYTRSWRIADGASVNLGSITTSVHAGTHADAPVHFQDEGEAIDEVSLDVFIGPAHLIDLEGKATITVADIKAAGFSGEERLLIRTGAWREGDPFPTSFPVLTPDVPDYLGEMGVQLLGLDLPSVDAFDSKDLPNHHALYLNDIQIIESLDLYDVPPGSYELIALPLKILGADASPVRAILRRG